MRSKIELLRQFPLQWTIYWLLVPNLGIILMWPIGGPPMRAALILYGFAALVISQLPWKAVRCLGLTLLMLWNFVIYLAAMFSIPTLNFAMFIQFLLDIRPLSAPEYVLGGIVFVAILVVAVSQAPRVPRFNRALQFAWAVVAVLALGIADQMITARSAATYRTRLPASMTFSSAARQVNLGPDPARHHVLLVVVEALGLPTAPEEKRLFEAAWHRPEWRGRYDMRFGDTPFYGSTTSGELRELCGIWSDHVRFDFDHAHCLPERFRAAGYGTSALHAFSGGLFDRAQWYPKLAFGRIEFVDDLERQGAGRCGGVFPGACDKDIPAIIGRRLASAKGPQFIYWLTLNSHLPIMTAADGGAECTVGSPAWKAEFPRVCRMVQKHQELSDAIGRMITAPDFPATDILIVGDHKPPFFDRRSRAHFDASRVPWIYLRARNPGPLQRERLPGPAFR